MFGEVGPVVAAGIGPRLGIAFSPLLVIVDDFHIVATSDC